MGIKHTVPAGLPTGTVTGKVAGDDWRADHLHIPFEVPLFMAAGNTAVAATVSAAANTEIYPTSKVTRSIVDLSQASQFRLVALCVAAGNVAGAAIKMSYMTTNSATWTNIDMAATTTNLVIGASAGTIRDTGWVNMAAGAKIDNCYISCCVAVAFGTTAPTFSFIQCYFR